MIHASCTNNKEVDEIEKQINKNFKSICNWFVDNKLIINFGEDKTKSILFAYKKISNNVHQLNITYNHIRVLDEAISVNQWY